MATMATLLLSSSLALPLPLSASSVSTSTSTFAPSHRTSAAHAHAHGAVRVLGSASASASGSAWRQFGTHVEAVGQRRRGRVVCEVAVELGGSRSSEGEEQEKKVGAGTRIRVLGPLKVFHVPKNPELDIGGMEGEVKEVVTTFKGKPVSATFPYKVQLVTTGEEVKKFFVHLKDDEFEVVE
ncbi:hypothetical protein M758_4G000700 [Ceratodon purpureus]|uniref:Ferredoxin thioredoxin reductase alpha chain domain-containing protein n=1 Tax=Ceratodon purpureus TaxID=3225 RepID=A0A8T0I6J3_CERPU|nr:hypothetical protein KC19_4G000900 [Ceratodon purpureus]KAG0617589.1 hypothetical protein M758_4G000700 [Ceratodon purpureus]